MGGNRRRKEWYRVSTSHAEKGIGLVEACVWKQASLALVENNSSGPEEEGIVSF